MTWEEFIHSERKELYFKAIMEYIAERDAQDAVIYPHPKCWFRAFTLTPIESVRVVIIGQDPYHGERQADGLAFSVPDFVKVPGSLKRIFMEIEQDLKLRAPNSGNLERWAKQGVLLLNTTLTVEKDQPASHSKIGWSTFTDTAIKLLELRDQPVVYMLWGRHAQEKWPLITNKNRLVLRAPHPSPLARDTSFVGCQHFSKANDWLEKKGAGKIVW